MKKLVLFSAFFAFLFSLSAQNTLTLTFQGQDQNGAYFQLDSVQIVNLTQGWTETLVYPDTELILTISVGINDYTPWNNTSVFPNPFEGNTNLSIVDMEVGPVHLSVTDVQGRLCAEYSGIVQSGTNTFSISLKNPQLYFVTIKTTQGVYSTKLVNVGSGNTNHIALAGHFDMQSGLDYVKKLRFDSEKTFVLGDEMRYTGYATIDGEMRVSEVITQDQLEDDTIGLVFFQDAIPCSDMPTVTDHEGNVYSTLQVGTQCWMAENMRAATSPSTGTNIVYNSSVQNSYSGKMARWYNNDSTTYANTSYGLLYNWNAVVDTFNMALGEISEGVDSYAVNVAFTGPRRGVCPEGWHVPSNAEWNALVNYVKSKDEYYCGGASTKIAKAFASTEGWVSNSTACNVGNDMESNNSLGFNAFPSGFFGNGNFSSLREYSAFWTADQNGAGSAKTWGLYYNNYGMYPSGSSNKSYGYSLRCVRD